MLTIKFSSIPAVLTTTLADGKTLDFVAIDTNNVELWLNNRLIKDTEKINNMIPANVLDKVKTVFNEVFSLPLNSRQQYMDTHPKFEVSQFSIN